VRASRLGAASSSTALARLSGDTRNRPLRHYIWGESSSGICAHTACSSTPWPNPHSTRQRRPAPPSSRHTARHACVPPARLRAPRQGQRPPAKDGDARGGRSAALQHAVDDAQRAARLHVARGLGRQQAHKGQAPRARERRQRQRRQPRGRGRSPARREPVEEAPPHLRADAGLATAGMQDTAAWQCSTHDAVRPVFVAGRDLHSEKRGRRRTAKPAAMPARWPRKDARGTTADVSARLTNGEAHIGISATPSTEKAPLPRTASTVILRSPEHAREFRLG
jgi:hypothetical protein